MPDEMCQVIITDGSEIERGDGVVQARDEIWCGVDQCAVEIEYDKGRFHEESTFR